MKTLNFAYHITTKKAYNKIKKEGLIPKIGKLSKEYGEKEKRIYFFLSKEEAENALSNWLGEAIEEHYGDDVECVMLKVDLSSFKIPLEIDDNGVPFFEQSIDVPIEPQFILFDCEC